jgi:LuxR family maltose regulon positive regulatory protein
MLTGETLLLQTKLAIPPPRAHTLVRERLLARMPAAPGVRLVLVSAPAGFGKTTLLATWCHALAEQNAATAAWLALDERDNDPARFLAYLVAALRQAMPLPNQLDDGIAPPIESFTSGGELVLTRLINALAALERDMVLVLDDYHIISAPAVHAAVAFLLDHVPDRVRLVIGTRADPPLPLARLRARDQLVEVRAVDLRFTPDEIQAFVQALTNLPLAPAEAQAINEYVEGWPAGIQLMALALQGDSRSREAEIGGAALGLPIGDVPARLNGSQRHVFAYLADEVFERQPAHLKTFLLQTALLDRMCGPLCDAVLGVGGWGLAVRDRAIPSNPQLPSPNTQDSYSRLVLEELDRANLFVSPLDGERRWYRYHHLFRAFLCTRLDREPPIAVAELHRRASVWYERNQLIPDAVEHMLAAGEAKGAAELIERSATAVIERGEYATLHRWLEQIPDAVLEARPALCLWAAWAALLAGEVERIERLLGRAERVWLAEGNHGKLGEVAHLQAHLARLRHNAAETIEFAQRALANLAEEELTLRAGSILGLGAGQLLAGKLDAASATLSEAYADCRAHNFLGSLVARVLLGDLATKRGQLHAAAEQYKAAISAVGQRGLWERWEAAVRLGNLARERNDLTQAEDILRTALTAAEQEGVAVYLLAGYIALARTLGARGDGGAAEIALDWALQAAGRLGSPEYTRQIRAYRARLALARGDLAAAQRWQVEAADLADDLSYAREVEALTLARVLIAQGRSDPRSQVLHTAHTILQRLRLAAEVDGRIDSLIEILALMALVGAAAGRREEAVRALHHALALAAPEGYARIFLDEGASMHLLLAECRGQIAHQERGIAVVDGRWLLTYLDGLLAAFPHDGCYQGLRPPVDNLEAEVVEVLSERELEVLRLIAEGASNQAIAGALVISIGTVKSHINHILGKLAAGNRTEAVARARELGLLAYRSLSASAPSSSRPTEVP